MYHISNVFKIVYNFKYVSIFVNWAKNWISFQIYHKSAFCATNEFSFTSEKHILFKLIFTIKLKYSGFIRAFMWFSLRKFDKLQQTF